VPSGRIVKIRKPVPGRRFEANAISSPSGDQAGWPLYTDFRPRVSHVTAPCRSTTARSVKVKPTSASATTSLVRSGDQDTSRTVSPRSLATRRTSLPSPFITNRAAFAGSTRRILIVASRELANAIRSTSTASAAGATRATHEQATTVRTSTRRV
jgi:hypothetical protein